MDWIVKAASGTRFFDAQLRVVNGAGVNGVKYRPFNYQEATRQFRSWAFAAAMLNAQAVASVPLRLYVRKRNGKKLFATRGVQGRAKAYLQAQLRMNPSGYVCAKIAEWGNDFEQVTDKHPVLDLLGHPNPYSDGWIFTASQMIYLQLTGNAYVHPLGRDLEYEGEALRLPEELWAMPPQWTHIVPGKPGSGVWLDGYRFGASHTDEQFFPADEVGHCKLPNPKDQFYGLGKIEAGWDCLKIDIAQRETDQALFDNGARPDYAIIVKQGATQGQLKEMQEEINRVFRGTLRSGQPMLLTGDTQVFPLQWQPKDLGDRTIITEEIAAVFGVPVSMLKANDPNLASAQTGFSTWREATILSYCRLWEEFWNGWLLPRFGLEDDALLAYDNPVPEDNNEKLAQVNSMLSNGWATRNEVRVEQGLPEIEGGDVLLVPSGYQTVEQALKGPQPLASPFTFAMPQSDTAAAVDSAVKGVAEALKQAPPLSPEAAAEGAPGYRRAPNERRCEVCQYGSGQRCTLYDFEFGADMVCDAWAMPTAATPIPAAGEEREGWMLRCMADSAMQAARPDPDQRASACAILWDTRDIEVLQSEMKHEHCGCCKADDPRAGEREAIILKLRAKIRTVFEAQRAAVLAWLMEHPKAIKALPDELTALLRGFDEQLADAMRDEIGLQLINGGKLGYERINLDPAMWDLTRPEVAEFIRGYTIRLAGAVNATTISNISATLAEGFGTGETTRELAQRVGAVFEQADGYRAEMIARTESARAFVRGTDEAWKQSGVVEGRRPLVAAGACDICQALGRMYAHKSVPPGVPFLKVGESLQVGRGKVFVVDYADVYGGDLHPMDGCGVQAVLKRESQ